MRLTASWGTAADLVRVAAVSLCKRPYTRGEQLADRYLHRVALALAGLAATILVALSLRHEDPLLFASVALYCLGLVGMLSSSALCNNDLADHQSPRARRFQRLDHAAILFLIAATYTPFTLNTMSGATGWALFGFVWLVALTGIGVTLLRRAPLARPLAVSLYLLLGWSIIAALEPLANAVPFTGLILLLSGGALYTVGVVFYVCYRLPYHNVIWHAFVVGAAGCHYGAVLAGVVLHTPATA